MRGATGKDAVRTEGGSRTASLRSPTFVAGLQVVLNRAGERLIDPPLLPEDVALQAPQDGAYLRTRMNKRPFVTIPPTEIGQASLPMVTMSLCLVVQAAPHSWTVSSPQLACAPRTGRNCVFSIFTSQSASHGAWHLQTSR